MLRVINSRQSVRAWTEKKVAVSIIRRILEAGMNAPSAGNEQAWQFVVVTEKELLERIAAVHPGGDYVGKAPCAILVCGDTRLEEYKGMWVEDCSAAIENMLLAMHALKLGGVWTGIYPQADRIKSFTSLLKLPKSVVPLALVPFGYPAEPLKKRPSRYKKTRVHFNSW
ncbi:MAG: nitroreductase family protein [Elusimicrobiota bacterium]|nr:nitroreductase family protein [Elusimicrobiota bacterium]